jgi:hypothetical protein
MVSAVRGAPQSRENIRLFGEVFTPTETVLKMLELIPDHAWEDPEYVFLEPTCGDGQFLVEILRKRIASGISIEESLNTIIGMDISPENIRTSKNRMWCVARDAQEKRSRTTESRFKAILQNNIFLVEDSLATIREYKAGKGMLADFLFVYNDPTGNGATA